MKKVIFLSVILVFLNCCSKENDSPDDLVVKNANIELKAGGTAQIELTSSLPVTYTSANEFNASVSTSGLVQANKVGKTEISITNTVKTAKVNVSVTPVYSTYKDPYLNFGATRADVIKAAGEPSKTNEYEDLIYENYSNAAILGIYYFENDKLVGFDVEIRDSYKSELDNFLIERYVKNSSVEGIEWALYINSLNYNTATMTIIVWRDAESSNIIVSYKEKE